MTTHRNLKPHYVEHKAKSGPVIRGRKEEVTTLRELEKRATPGPWSLLDRGPAHDFDPALIVDDRRKGIAKTEYNDAAFIVALRNAAPLLLDVVEAARHVDDQWWEATDGPALNADGDAMANTPEVWRRLRDALKALESTNA